MAQASERLACLYPLLEEQNQNVIDLEAAGDKMVAGKWCSARKKYARMTSRLSRSKVHEACGGKGEEGYAALLQDTLGYVKQELRLVKLCRATGGN